ncbi:NRAMP (natural resistance-associated macrophage protein) metal ion transporters [Propionispira arboris]|uniref:NRAMP (Natural resistance-associated macrophage protein) metal ion transporters n=1 Tax=Propionispira arboris TaxID=84035 RepID=A0A1H7CBH4_9FIRM|nr:Nramp family divalent metal transporter [Propionispira arboris]SEJ83970.1 NRAMP (natural resistance-associated macrophage protein) metal ion transporters [Propionispira arboris]
MKNMRMRLSLFFAVMGPGVVTAFADNDAGGIATYASAGATYGYDLLFTLLVSSICLAMAQEISARTGAITGRGLSDLIRESFGVKWTFFAMIVLMIANVGTTASEFSGIAASFEMFGVNKIIAVPLMAFTVWWAVLKGNYSRIEKVFFVLCATFLSYIISGVIINPPWEEVLMTSFTPTFHSDAAFLMMAIGIIGTTITPWGQFYIQAAVVDKGITVKDYKYIFWDVMLGAFFTWLIAFFVIVTTAATFNINHIEIESVKDAAMALEPLAGKYASMLFSFGLLGASMLAAFILPLSSAYAVCEAFGFESGVSKKPKEASVFFGVYTVIILLGAGIALWPNISLTDVMLVSQVVNGVLLPPILIFMVLIANNQTIMGQYKNSEWYNIVAWIFTIVLIALTLMLLLSTIAPEFMKNLMEASGF